MRLRGSRCRSRRFQLLVVRGKGVCAQTIMRFLRGPKGLIGQRPKIQKTGDGRKKGFKLRRWKWESGIRPPRRRISKGMLVIIFAPPTSYLAPRQRKGSRHSARLARNFSGVCAIFRVRGPW